MRSLRCAGECDAHGFGALFSAAWQGSTLKVYAPGTNLLPTIHAADLAAYVSALLGSCTGSPSAPPASSGPCLSRSATLTRAAQQQAAAGQGQPGAGPAQQYLLVADARAVAQRELVEAVSRALGSGLVEEAQLGELLLGGQPVGAAAARLLPALVATVWTGARRLAAQP